MNKKETMDPEEKTLSETVEHLASLQFLVSEVEKIIERQLDDDLMVAYERGQLKGEAEVRAGIKRMAVQGSAPSQKAYLDLVQKRKRSRNSGKR